MRFLLLLLALPGVAFAQVTTNDQALQALKPAAPKTAAKTARPEASTPTTPRARVTHHIVRHAAPSRAAKMGPLPPVPTVPPANPVILPPPAVLPAHTPPSPPPVKLVPTAPTTATPIEGGTRLTFGTGSADLNQVSLDAIEAIAAKAKADPLMEVTVTAWAPGVPEDPSTPHRLSLDRALVVRAVLIHAGIASERIQAVAKGFNGIGDGPPDRADVVAARPRSTPKGAPAHS